MLNSILDLIGWNDYTVFTISPNGKIAREVRNREPFRYDDSMTKVEISDGIEVWNNAIKYQRSEHHLFMGKPFHGTIYVYKRDARTGRYCKFELNDRFQ